MASGSINCHFSGKNMGKSSKHRVVPLLSLITRGKKDPKDWCHSQCQELRYLIQELLQEAPSESQPAESCVIHVVLEVEDIETTGFVPY